MTAILAVNGDKLPCGCPASELTLANRVLDGVFIFDLSQLDTRLKNGCRTVWICRKHNRIEIMRQTGLRRIGTIESELI